MAGKPKNLLETEQLHRRVIKVILQAFETDKAVDGRVALVLEALMLKWAKMPPAERDAALGHRSEFIAQAEAVELAAIRAVREAASGPGGSGQKRKRA